MPQRSRGAFGTVLVAGLPVVGEIHARSVVASTQQGGEGVRVLSPRMLKQNLSLKLQQKLSPQQIQLMKLLQIPTRIAGR